jgi:hypothetical protein
VEDVVRRGLAVERDDRFPDVRSFVDALRSALGGSGSGELPARWLPVDPELTQPGNRPSLVPAREDLPEPVPPKRRPRWPAAVLAAVLLVAGAAGGFAVWHTTHDTVTVKDTHGVLSVTVPQAWSREVSRQGWTPPDSSISQPAVSAGDGRGWATSGQGVFAGLLPESKLPTTLPQHEGCDSVGKPVHSTSGDPSVTVTSTGCPGGAVIIEQASQVSATKLLWVQVRGDSASVAERVLDSVQTYGSL